jgi:hypothetical protein
MTRRSTLPVAFDYLDLFPDHKIFAVSPGQKRPPCFKGYATMATGDRKLLKRMHSFFPGCSWGLAPAKSDIVVLDADLKPGKNGRRSLDWLEILYGPLPPTSTVRTTTGGLHYRYQATNSVRHVLKQNGFGEHLDCPPYTIIPGVEVSTGRYEFVNDLPLAPAPWWFAEVLGAARERAAGSKAAVVELDTADARKRAVELLQGYATSPIIRNAQGKQTNGPAIQGSGGDERTFQVALNVGDLGISEELCLDLMFEHFNHVCDPPWQYDDAAPADRLSTKVRSAYASRETPLGSRTAAADFAGDEYTLTPKEENQQQRIRERNERKMAEAKRFVTLKRKGLVS